MVAEKKEAVEVEELVEAPETTEEESKFILRFTKPYKFEGTTYTELDLSGIEHITAADMIAAQRLMGKDGTVSVLPEMSLQYACIIAARVAKLPIEFFRGVPARDAIRIKNMVSGFIFGAD